jgi:hypothetical protein
MGIMDGTGADFDVLKTHPLNGPHDHGQNVVTVSEMVVKGNRLAIF